MASWLTHLRIADVLLRRLYGIDEIPFIIGNIGPDCSQYDKAAGNLIPASSFTHFTPTGRKLDIEFERFYVTYLKDKPLDKDAHSFYLGYYIHLLTDYFWTKIVWQKIKEEYLCEFPSVKELQAAARRDWFAYDRQYLKENPDFRIFQTFCAITEFENSYLNFYPFDAFTMRIPQIKEVYSPNKADCEKYRFISKEQDDEFMTQGVLEIHRILSENNLC